MIGLGKVEFKFIFIGAGLQRQFIFKIFAKKRHLLILIFHLNKSREVKFMVTQISQITVHQPLGYILKEAGLISDYQIEVALQDQQYDDSLLFGEILALRGWIAQETADFFVMDFPTIKQQQKKEKIGYYLKQAKLLTEDQINSILEEQKHNLIRFGSVAVLKGYLKQKTLDFLSENLFKNHNNNSSYIMTFNSEQKAQATEKEKQAKMTINSPETHIQSHQETYSQFSKDTYLQSEKEDLGKLPNEELTEVKWID